MTAVPTKRGGPVFGDECAAVAAGLGDGSVSAHPLLVPFGYRAVSAGRGLQRGLVIG
jgi:hypothetical protein